MSTSSTSSSSLLLPIENWLFNDGTSGCHNCPDRILRRWQHHVLLLASLHGIVNGGLTGVTSLLSKNSFILASGKVSSCLVLRESGVMSLETEGKIEAPSWHVDAGWRVHGIRSQRTMRQWGSSSSLILSEIKKNRSKPT